ncbi:5226_t:CDS:2, partial [Gigaspora margarita]
MTSSISSDWLEIMESEVVAENHQEKNKIADFCKENSTVHNVEGSSNFCNERADYLPELAKAQLSLYNEDIEVLILPMVSNKENITS